MWGVDAVVERVDVKGRDTRRNPHLSLTLKRLCAWLQGGVFAREEDDKTVGVVVCALYIIFDGDRTLIASCVSVSEIVCV